MHEIMIGLKIQYRFNTLQIKFKVYLSSFVETLRKFIIAELSIRKLGSS